MSTARIDLDAIRSNVGVLAERARGAAVMAVVKADGYGHGVIPSARAALDGGATWLGVAGAAEALEVRAAGIDAPLLAWLLGPGDDLTPLVEADVDLGIYADWALAAARGAAQSLGRPARVHLKADTGLGRGGAMAAVWPDLVEAAAKFQAEGTVEVVGVFSPLA